jgi:hypothetical protein
MRGGEKRAISRSPRLYFCLPARCLARDFLENTVLVELLTAF